MARIRSVKPELRTDLTVSEWPREVRYAWVLLLGYLDDYGRGRDDTRLVVADLFPLDRDVTEKKIDQWLDRMAKSGPLCRYSVDGETFLHAVKWEAHQRISHPTDSKLPPCPVHDFPEPLRNDSGTAPESGRKDSAPIPEPLRPSRAPAEQGTGNREKEQGTGSKVVALRADEPRPDVERLCNLLADGIEANGTKRPEIGKKWLDAARLMVDTDGRTEEQVRGAIEWSQAHPFWRSNILSMPKLREKYDQMRLQADREGPPGGKSRAQQETDAMFERAARRMGVTP